MLEQTKNNAAAFHVVNLGCKVNRVESDDFAATLIADGGREVPIEAADFIVVNTCTVTGEAEKKTRKAVRQALRPTCLVPRRARRPPWPPFVRVRNFPRALA